MTAVAIAALDAGALEARTADLAGILHACVLDGASVGFVLPFERHDAADFWRDTVTPPLAAGRRVLLAAIEAGRCCGTVQLLHDMPPNQPHRAEVAKLLVHPAARRRGIARALMLRIEAEARARGRSLLTLDTRSGDPAQSLYASLGYTVAGEIPGWCRDTATERLDATTIMYRRLA